MKAPIDHCQCFPRLEVRNVLEAELKAQLQSPETSIETYKCWFSKGERKKISRNIKSTRSLAGRFVHKSSALHLCSPPEISQAFLRDFPVYIFEDKRLPPLLSGFSSKNNHQLSLDSSLTARLYVTDGGTSYTMLKASQLVGKQKKQHNHSRASHRQKVLGRCPGTVPT
jgi:hypothetical protein